MSDFASGGPIKGPGSNSDDRVLWTFGPGDHVLTAREVEALGGHDKIEQLRQSLRRPDATD